MGSWRYEVCHNKVPFRNFRRVSGDYIEKPQVIHWHGHDFYKGSTRVGPPTDIASEDEIQSVKLCAINKNVKLKCLQKLFKHFLIRAENCHKRITVTDRQRDSIYSARAAISKWNSWIIPGNTYTLSYKWSVCIVMMAVGLWILNVLSRKLMPATLTELTVWRLRLLIWRFLKWTILFDKRFMETDAETAGDTVWICCEVQVLKKN